MRAEVADYPSHREMRQYFMDFAEHFGLRPHYWFGTRVLKVEPVGEGPAPLWRITWSQHGGPSQTTEFKGVVIANGTLAAAVGLGLQLWIPGLVLWIVGHALAVWGARVDPQFMQVFARHIEHRPLLDV
jgi:hypothetical protein